MGRIADQAAKVETLRTALIDADRALTAANDAVKAADKGVHDATLAFHTERTALEALTADPTQDEIAPPPDPRNALPAP